MKLGSLFDGSGGFPLAGVLNGITPVWASEIEPYPIAVTSARLPSMKHLGSITEINGRNIDPVDIITFGSPCQDLSIAGNQKGIENGARSSLFFQAIRIIKEMRDATNGVYPTYAVWENVPGAFSSNHGNDFRLVLEALASISEPEVSIPKSEKWQRSGEIVGDGWSIAWRTLDAQFWGVPQRRKRIYLVADFGGERAGEILFEQEGLRGHSAESGTAGQSAAGDAQGSVGRMCGAFCAGASAKAGSIGWQEEVAPTLKSANAGLSMHAVCYPIDSHQQDSRFKICEDGVCPTVPGQMGTGGNNGPMVLEVEPVVNRMRGFGDYEQDEKCSAVKARDYKDATDLIVEANISKRRYIIRRLTPLETCRLQGFPDWWEDGVQGSDSARYKMWGNGIALPCAVFVLGRIAGQIERREPNG